MSRLRRTFSCRLSKRLPSSRRKAHNYFDAFGWLATKEMLMRSNKILDATAFAILLTVGMASQCLFPPSQLRRVRKQMERRTWRLDLNTARPTCAVEPKDFDQFVAVFRATGGSASKPAILTVTPTPSSTCGRRCVPRSETFQFSVSRPWSRIRSARKGPAIW